MQPGPPYPPQQPGQAGGQPPYPGQPYGAPNPGPPPYGGQVPGQPLYAPPAPRGMKTWPILLILIAALVVIGGGSAIFALANHGGGNSTDVASGTTSDTGTNAVAPSSTTTSPSSSPGRYQKLPNCTALNGGPFTFPVQPAFPQGVVIGQNCYSTAEIDGAWVTFAANMQVFIMPDGISQAEQAAQYSAGQPVSAPGFENAPYVVFGTACVFDYFRSNEEVELEFTGLAGVSDAASCASVAMPYAQQYYNLIG